MSPRTYAAKASPTAAPPASPRLKEPPAYKPAASAGRPLPGAVRGHMESFFGHDFSSVRVHEGPHAAGLGAVAYTQGNDIHFSPGSFRPEGPAGQELLGHELTHVVQQRAGRVEVPQGKGAPINADPRLEAEADRLGRQAARNRPHSATCTAGKSAAPCTCARCSGAGHGASAPSGSRAARAAERAPGSHPKSAAARRTALAEAPDRQAGAILARAPIAAHAAAAQRRAEGEGTAAVDRAAAPRSPR